MFAVFRIVMIDDVILTDKTVDELKELFKTKYGVDYRNNNNGYRLDLQKI